MTNAIRTAFSTAEWPERDRECWNAAIRTGEIFEPDGRAANWAKPTRLQVCKGYGKWLWALHSFGAIDTDSSPGDRVTQDNLRRYVQTLESQGLSSVTVASRLTDLMEAIRVMDPAAELALLRRLVSNLQQRAHPSRNKAARIRPPAEIWAACLNEMKHIFGDSRPLTIERASRYRDALVLGFLVWSPIRRRNLTALELGITLRLESGRWRVHFGADETKDKSSLSFCLPDDHEYQQAFSNYLTGIRPRLLKSGEVSADAFTQLRGPLWVSTRTSAMSEQALYYAVNRCSERLLGARLNPHLLRDCAASTIASERPEYILAAARVLGHSQLSTTLAHYEHASMLAAGSCLQEVIGEIQSRKSSGSDHGSLDRDEASFTYIWEFENWGGDTTMPK